MVAYFGFPIHRPLSTCAENLGQAWVASSVAPKSGAFKNVSWVESVRRVPDLQRRPVLPL